MKNLQFIIRIIASPFVLGLLLIYCNWIALKRVLLFLRYGEECFNYQKNDRKTIWDIYMLIKDKEEEEALKHMLEKEKSKIDYQKFQNDWDRWEKDRAEILKQFVRGAYSLLEMRGEKDFLKYIDKFKSIEIIPGEL
jgi:hypothetical protein